MQPARPSLFALAAFLLPLAAAGTSQAEGTDSEKLDTLLVMQKQVVRTIKNDPLEGKTFGVEFNFPRLLIMTEATSFSGGISLFNIDRNAEIAFPFIYTRSNISDLIEDLEDDLSNLDFIEFTLDAHYRYFLGNTQNGFFLSGFARAAWLDGVLLEDFIEDLPEGEINDDNARDTETKFGVGVGLGWRKFSYKGLYWGTSLNVGRYLTGEHNRFIPGYMPMNSDMEIIFDVEFFKFGWAF